MSYLQNTNNDIYQQLMSMNASKGGGGGGFIGGNKSGAMNKQIDECSSFAQGTPEYTACQERLKEIQEQQQRKNDSVKGDSIYDPDNLLAQKNPNDHRGYTVDRSGPNKKNSQVRFQNPL